MKLFRAGERAVQSHIVSHVSEKLSMEEHEKVERNDSNETGKNRDLQEQEDPDLSLSPYMKTIKVGIDTRYAVWISRHAIVAPKFAPYSVRFSTKVEQHLNRA